MHLTFPNKGTLKPLRKLENLKHQLQSKYNSINFSQLKNFVFKIVKSGKVTFELLDVYRFARNLKFYN